MNRLCCRNQLLSVEEISHFFDEIDENDLEPLHVCVNKHLPNDNPHKWVTIQVQFISYYHNYRCRYTEEDKEIARANFMRIFFDNLDTIAKIRGYAKSVEDITKAENFSSYLKGSNESNNDSLTNAESEDTAEATTNRKDKVGALGGNADATQMSTLTDRTTHTLIQTDRILEEGEEKYLGILDPHARQISHSVTVTKANTVSNSVDRSKSVSANVTRQNTSYSNNRGSIAQNQLSMLYSTLPRLRTQFLEAFSILFYTP